MSVIWRDRLFFWGSITGFLAVLILLLLLAISNDRMVKKLGQQRWKKLQRLAVASFVLTAAHGWAFQLLESRAVWVIGVLFILTLLVVVIRFAAPKKS